MQTVAVPAGAIFADDGLAFSSAMAASDIGVDATRGHEHFPRAALAGYDDLPARLKPMEIPRANAPSARPWLRGSMRQPPTPSFEAGRGVRRSSERASSLEGALFKQRRFCR